MAEPKTLLSIGEDPTWGKLVSLNPLHPSIELKQNSVIFGRTPAMCQVTYTSPTVSGRHCKIYRDPSITKSNIVFLEDTSTNGTFVNNELIGKGSKILINNGCEIAIIPKKGTDKISYIYQDCNEEQREIEQGGPQPYYNLFEVLGSGNFATVRMAEHKETGEKFALKVIDKKKMSLTSQRKDALMDEVNVLTKVKHENIISIKEVFETTKTLYLVLELVTGGELFDKIIEEKKFSEDISRYVLRQICLAVQYLHGRGIAHRDLKPENILLAAPNAYIVKISDFGLSRALDEGSFMKTMCGTPQYVAPEVLQNSKEGYSKQVDLWSIGVILYIVLSGFPPFGDPTQTNFFEKVKRGGFSFPSPYWDDISDEAKDLIKKLIVVDPNQRLTIDQTLAHPWFANHKDDVATINKNYIPPQPRVTKEKEEGKEGEKEEEKPTKEEESKDPQLRVDPKIKEFLEQQKQKQLEMEQISMDHDPTYMKGDKKRQISDNSYIINSQEEQKKQKPDDN